MEREHKQRYYQPQGQKLAYDCLFLAVFCGFLSFEWRLCASALADRTVALPACFSIWR
jgi:hypothetical protein